MIQYAAAVAQAIRLYMPEINPQPPVAKRFGALMIYSFGSYSERVYRLWREHIFHVSPIRQMWKTRLFSCRASSFYVEKPVETVDKGAFSVLCDTVVSFSRTS
jgi:hypothetical protein